MIVNLFDHLHLQGSELGREAFEELPNTVNYWGTFVRKVLYKLSHFHPLPPTLPQTCPRWDWDIYLTFIYLRFIYLTLIYLTSIYLRSIYLSSAKQDKRNHRGGTRQDVGWMNNQDFWIEQFASSL